MDPLFVIAAKTLSEWSESTKKMTNVRVFRKFKNKRKFLGALNIIEFTAEKLCSLGLNKTVCLEAVSSFGPVLFKSLVDKIYNPIHFCENVFLCPRTTHKENLKHFVEDILKDKPATNVPVPTKKSTYNILQISDPHVDLEYQIVKSSIWDFLSYIFTGS